MKNKLIVCSECEYVYLGEHAPCPACGHKPNGNPDDNFISEQAEAWLQKTANWLQKGKTVRWCRNILLLCSAICFGITLFAGLPMRNLEEQPIVYLPYRANAEVGTLCYIEGVRIEEVGDIAWFTPDFTNPSPDTHTVSSYYKIATNKQKSNIYGIAEVKVADILAFEDAVAKQTNGKFRIYGKIVEPVESIEYSGIEANLSTLASIHGGEYKKLYDTLRDRAVLEVDLDPPMTEMVPASLAAGAFVLCAAFGLLLIAFLLNTIYYGRLISLTKKVQAIAAQS